MYAGNTLYCTDPAVPARANCIGASPSAGGAPREWRDWRVGYAWVGDALVTTLALVSRDGWADIMRAGMDVTGQDTGPCVDAGEGGAAYFLAVVFLGGIVGINILVATFIDRSPPRVDGAAWSLGRPQVLAAPILSRHPSTRPSLGRPVAASWPSLSLCFTHCLHPSITFASTP